METTEEIQPISTIHEDKPSFLKEYWWIIVVLLVAILLAVGIFLFLNNKLEREMAPKPLDNQIMINPDSSPEDELLSEIGKEGTSDEISSIEDDLEATKLTDLDRELTDIETELALP